MNRCTYLLLLMCLLAGPLQGCKRTVEDCMHDKRQLWDSEDAAGNRLEGDPEFWDALADCERLHGD